MIEELELANKILMEIDLITKKLIRAQYSLEDELKILRLKLNGDLSLWTDYYNDVFDIVTRGKIFKNKHFPKELTHE